MRESKAELTDRLRREGRWDAFKKRREELKANGAAAKQAWFEAAAEFPPENPVRLAEPSIEWDDAKAAVEAALASGNELEFLTTALDVKVPAGTGGPKLWGMLQTLRARPMLRDEFCGLMMRRWAEREDKSPKVPMRWMTLEERLLADRG